MPKSAKEVRCVKTRYCSKNVLQAEFNKRVVQKFTRLKPADIGIGDVDGARHALRINQDTGIDQRIPE